MTTIQTDADYQLAIQTLLKEVGEYVKYPEYLTGTDARERLLYLVISSVRTITNSAPHLRGAVLKGVKELMDLEQSRPSPIKLKPTKRRRRAVRGSEPEATYGIPK